MIEGLQRMTTETTLLDGHDVPSEVRRSLLSLETS